MAAGLLHHTVHVSLGRTLALGLLLWLGAGLLLVWQGSASPGREMEHSQALTRAEGERILNLAKLTVSEAFAAVSADLRHLSHETAPEPPRHGGAAPTFKGLSEEYAHMLMERPGYERIHFLDLSGREGVAATRAGGVVAVTGVAERQVLGATPFFQALVRLGPGELHVEPVGLPAGPGAGGEATPVIRFGMPVFDEAGTRRGYVAIDYRLAHLLAKIQAVAAGPRQVWLLDGAGEWLRGPSAAESWSGLLPDRRGQAFALRHPEAWQAMRGQDSGTVRVGEAHYRFLQVKPLVGLADGTGQPVAPDAYAWYLVLADLPTHIAAGHLRLGDLAIKRGLLLAALLGVLSFALAYAIVRQRSLAATLAQVVDNLPVFVAYIDGAGRFRFNNRAYLDVYGLEPRQLYGRTVAEALGPTAHGQLSAHLDQALAGQRVQFEMHTDAGPGPRDLAVTFVPDRAGEGRVRGVFALFSDVSQAKEMERQEREHLKKLARYARLASVGEITTEIAHQVNQPLAAIAMLSHAAQRTVEGAGDPGKLAEWMATINAQAKRASQVVQRLRRFAHRDDTSPVELAVNDAIGEVLALLEPVAKGKALALTFLPGPDLPRIRATPVLLEQVVYDLLHTALQCAERMQPPGQVSVRSQVDAGGAQICVQAAQPMVDPDASGGMITHGQGWPDDAGCDELSVSRDIVHSFDGKMACWQLQGGGMRVCFCLPAGGA